MAFVVESVTRVSAGGKAKWEIKSDKLVHVGTKTFVKLACWDGSLCRLVLEDCPAACDGANKSFSLSSSNGLHQLMKLRNEAQTLELQKACEPRSSLCIGVRTPPSKRPRISRMAIKQMRSNPGTVCITVPAFAEHSDLEMDVLRPVHPRDELGVLLDKSVLERIIRFIQHEGFSVENSSRHDRSLPKGVWNKRVGDTHQYIVPVVSNGKRKLKRATCIEDAIQIQNSELDELDPAPITDAERDDVAPPPIDPTACLDID